MPLTRLKSYKKFEGVSGQVLGANFEVVFRDDFHGVRPRCFLGVQPSIQVIYCIGV